MLEPLEPITIDQEGCVRCGGEGHKQIEYRPFTNPIELPGGDRLTHWAMCPTVNEPIMLLVRESPVLLRTEPQGEWTPSS